MSPDTAPLWEHCRRALEHGWRLGPHGLPLIGNGDWNDGMNRVGVEGQRRKRLAGLVPLRGAGGLRRIDGDSRHRTARSAAEWRRTGRRAEAADEPTAWDGEWYLRAFFDNGAPLGSHANEEVRIDSLPQSWAVISGAGDSGRSRRAMESAESHLVDERGPAGAAVYAALRSFAAAIPATSWAIRRVCAKMAASTRTGHCGWRWRGRGWARAGGPCTCCR